MKYLLFLVLIGALAWIFALGLKENLRLKGQLDISEMAKDLYFDTGYILRGEISTLKNENLRLESELHTTNFCISHLPQWGGGFGGPWTIEKYWRQEQLWVALKDYHTREAAEDVKAQLQSGQLKTRDLFR